jgi:predicted small secreted protein
MGQARAGRRRWAALALTVTILGGLTACNTIAGAGRDLESLGRTLSDSAERARP